MSQTIKREFEFEKETKNTYRFKEVGEDIAVGVLYVQKDMFDEEPGKLTVTIEVA